MLKKCWKEEIGYIFMISVTLLVFFGGYIHNTW